MYVTISVNVNGAHGESQQLSGTVYLSDTKVDVERAANAALCSGLDALEGWQESAPEITREENRVMEILREKGKKQC
jgi:hypothetical protein